MAAVPGLPPKPIELAHTESPTRKPAGTPGMPGPSRSTVPTTSRPGTCGKTSSVEYVPARTKVSTWSTAAAATVTRTLPGNKTGIGNWPNVMTSAPPFDEKYAAFILS